MVKATSLSVVALGRKVTTTRASARGTDLLTAHRHLPVRVRYHPGMGTLGVSVSVGACSIGGCAKSARARGWCVMHYSRWWKYGDPLEVRLIKGDDVARLMSHVRIDPSGCWIWTGSLNGKGYGQMHWRGRPCGAHRVSYALLRGALLDGMELDHLCRNRPCVNPDHLEQVTHQINVRRGRLGPRRTHSLAYGLLPSGLGVVGLLS